MSVFIDVCAGLFLANVFFLALAFLVGSVRAAVATRAMTRELEWFCAAEALPSAPTEMRSDRTT